MRIPGRKKKKKRGKIFSVLSWEQAVYLNCIHGRSLLFCNRNILPSRSSRALGIPQFLNAFTAMVDRSSAKLWPLGCTALSWKWLLWCTKRQENVWCGKQDMKSWFENETWRAWKCWQLGEKETQHRCWEERHILQEDLACWRLSMSMWELWEEYRFALASQFAWLVAL